MSFFHRTRVLILTLCASGTGWAAGEAVIFPAEQIDFFERKIRPVLVESCFKCHSTTGEKVKGGLVLDTRAALLKGGDTGPAVTPGDPEHSLLIKAIRYADEDMEMPPKKPLTPEQVRDFEEWVKMGLPDPRSGAPEAKPGIDLVKAREFWSLRPVRDPEVPAVRDVGWGRNPIDRFILAKLEEKSFRPNPDIEKRALLRRATFDLTGLPPTSEETDAFLQDESPEAFARVVDRLLASPRYGERWGRHWLDVVRYADTSGCNSDFPVPSVFRYRDYVVDSFNRDKPYDRFLREQIAGDLLPAETEEQKFEQIIATGYLAISRRFGSRNNEFHLTIDDTIDNLGKAVLGLSVSCARCHDHKYDPVLAKDYYALYGIFESTTYAFPGTEIYRHTKDFVPLVSGEDAEVFAQEARELAGLDDRVEHLKNERTRLLREDKREEEAAQKPFDATQPVLAEYPKLPRRTGADASQDLKEVIERQKELVVRQERLPKAYAVQDGKPRNTKLQRKGDPGSLGEEVPRGFLAVLGGQTLPPEEKGSGRRELAEWLADSANPLTARVMVNRIWQQHFGRGIVKSPNDFGLRGEAPTHPELLDWLASRFVESGWSIKAMHRLIMLSRAYQMSSAGQPEFLQADVNNDLFWRMDRRRLSAEEIRDSLLFVSGSLDLSPAGPHPFPGEAEWRYTQHTPFVADYPTKKRALFLMQQRIRKQPFLEIFDGADTNATTGMRPLSTTPIQALFLLNNELAHVEAEKLAERLEKEAESHGAQVDRAYRLVLGRPAEAYELEIANEYLEQMGVELEQSGISADQQPKQALASFVRVLVSSNEFLFVD